MCGTRARSSEGRITAVAAVDQGADDCHRRRGQDRDPPAPPEVAREMHQGIEGGRLVVVPQAGHLALLEQPEAVVAALRGWAA